MARESDHRLDAMIAEAVVDAYGEDEELAGFHAVLTDHLVLPFTTQVLGVDVVVEDLDLRPSSGMVALCRRGTHRQAIGLLDLPLPSPPPEGAMGYPLLEELGEGSRRSAAGPTDRHRRQARPRPRRGRRTAPGRARHPGRAGTAPLIPGQRDLAADHVSDQDG